MKLTNLLFFILVLSLAFFLLNKSMAAEIEKIMVQAPRDLSKIYHNTLSSTIISEENLREMNGPSIKDILEMNSSLSFPTSGGPGQIHGVQSRGSETRHTLILIDGMKMNDPTSPSESFNLMNLSKDQVQRIEIFHGAQSVIYGGGAMGGVINIITKKGRDSERSKLSLGAGNYKTSHSYIETAGFSHNLDYFLSAGLHQSEGVSAANRKRHQKTTPDGMEQKSFSSKFEYQINKNHSLQFSGHYLNGKNGLDTIGASGLQDNPYASLQSEEIPIKVSTNNLFFDEMWESNGSYSEVRTHRSMETVGNKDQFDGLIKHGEWENHFYFNHENSTALILGFEEENGRSKTQYEDISNKRLKSRFIATHHYFDKPLFFLFAGGRLEYHEIYKKNMTYQLLPGIRIPFTKTELKLGLSKSFKSPSVFQVYSFYGNRNLKPEKGLSKEINLEQQWGYGGRTKMTYFRNSYFDLFGFHPQTYKTINISRALIEGYELSHVTNLLEDHSARLSVTQYRKIKNISENRNLLRRPKWKGNLLFNFFKGRQLSYNLNATYVGTRLDYFSTTETVMMPSYMLFDLGMSYKFNDHSDLGFSIKNILDKDYEEVYGYGTLGRNYYLSLNYSF